MQQVEKTDKSSELESFRGDMGITAYLWQCLSV